MQERCAMKVSTDSCLFGAWAATLLKNEETILDIGAGTGLLSFMLAQRSTALFHSVEIETSCFDELVFNIDSSPWKTRITGYSSDIRDFDASVKYDLIISNPPFYEHQLKSPNNTTNLARHSDQLSLTSFFEHAKRLLNDNGRIVLLMPYYRKSEILSTAVNYKLFAVQIADVKQTQTHDTFRTMICFSTAEQEMTTETITIKDEKDSYTERFRDLLGEYYLKL
ncbi:MAG: tRNA1(Val) (adenine(37)-N6)-methyltransferase [bacterium]